MISFHNIATSTSDNIYLHLCKLDDTNLYNKVLLNFPCKLDMTLKCIWWASSNSVALGNVESPSNYHYSQTHSNKMVVPVDFHQWIK